MEKATSEPRIFAGTVQHALDAKHRVTIPSSWRRSLAGELYVVPDPRHGALLMLGASELQAMVAEVKEHATLSATEKRAFMRQFFSRAQSCSLDRQGRVVLPEEYCQALKLKEEVVLVGASSRIEVWHPAQWKKLNEREEADYQRVAELIGL